MNPELFCKHCPFVSTTETPPGDYATPSLTCSHVNQSPRPFGDCLSVVRTTCVPRMSLLGLPRDIFWSRFVRRTLTLKDKSLEPGGEIFSDWFSSPPRKWTEYRHRQPRSSLGHRWNIPKRTPSLEQFDSANQIGQSEGPIHRFCCLGPGPNGCVNSAQTQSTSGVVQGL